MNNYLYDNQLDLSPWTPNTQQSQLFKKILSFNIKPHAPIPNPLNPDPKKPSPQPQQYSLSEMSNKLPSPFRCQFNSFEELIGDELMGEGDSLGVLGDRRNVYGRNRTEPVGDLKDLRKEVDRRRLSELEPFRRYDDKKENARLSVHQQQFNPSLIRIFSRKKSLSIQNRLTKNQTQAFLKKNLISRHNQKNKVTRIGNIILPKIQICNFTNRLV